VSDQPRSYSRDDITYHSVQTDRLPLLEFDVAANDQKRACDVISTEAKRKASSRELGGNWSVTLSREQLCETRLNVCRIWLQGSSTLEVDEIPFGCFTPRTIQAAQNLDTTLIGLP